MTRLVDIGPLLTEYAADEHNIAEDFYCPCLNVANRYHRITGYFSSLVYLIAWPALRTFLQRPDPCIQIICSPSISERDRKGLVYGYEAENDQQLAARLEEELEMLLEDERLREPTQLLACLIAKGLLEIKFARIGDGAPASTKRMFHDKVGLFLDAEGDVVGFRGSMNETFLGLSPSLGHIDSIDVFPSWVGGRDATRVQNAIDRFARLWDGGETRQGVTLCRMPPEFASTLEGLAGEVDLGVALAALGGGQGESPGRSGVTLWPHQSDAVDTWEANERRGILAHATGSGKTVTGSRCVRRILEEQGMAVVVVPSVEVQIQWASAIRTITGASPLLCGGEGGSEWRENGLIRSAINSGEPTVIVAVLNTARTEFFIKQLRPSVERLLFVGDEVHRLGSPSSQRLLDGLNARMRLGLSATPERAGDTEGTVALLAYFGGVIHRYGLREALRDGRLTRYRYEIRDVRLTTYEQEEWNDLSHQIAVATARAKGSEDAAAAREHIRRLTQQRARIKKNAAGKPNVARGVLDELYEPGQRWLVYCDSIAQVQEVMNRTESLGLPMREFHSRMSGDRFATLTWFSQRGGVLVSIRCLDEGVDIPDASHGLILASSTNPREFIQRRGRLLRRKQGKHSAQIVDVLVLPSDVADPDASFRLMAPELSRALLFAESSESPSTISRLEDLCRHHHIPLHRLDQLAAEGSETDDDTPTETGVGDG